MRKPWSFIAIELLAYVQIGLALALVSNGISLRIAYERGTWAFELPQSISTSILSTLLNILTGGYPGFPKDTPGSISVLIYIFSFELILSSAILLVLKTKSLVFVRSTAIFALVLRATLGKSTGIFGNMTGYNFIFTLGSILIVAFLFLEPVQHYIQVQSQRHNNLVGRD